ncbi:hypothetical protein GA0070607_3159 [Micromonospora coriariae]|uniref:Uncharacterized protein n=1 Tax=Micromonospora coriariae TaxID=285665 RepID=A0A1C4W5H1_9ACTN|nr:hypothetical protein [Micromonospora coriariae]SCE91486.1 hypothetical protein GA0070607_3159 [Micromonospora coriariae]
MAVELLAAAASALVGAMATDAWGWAKTSFAQLFGNSDRTHAEAAERRLEASRTELEGLSGEELLSARSRVEAAWQARLGDLVEDAPEVAMRLESLVKEATARVSQTRTGSIQQHAVAFDNAQQAVQGQGVQTNTFGGGSGAAGR